MAKDVSSALIATRDATGVMRGRDVRVKLAGKLDPEVLQVLCQLAEVNHGNVLHLASLASMVDQMTDIIQSFTDVASNLKERTDQMVRAMGDEIEGSPTDVEPTPSKH